MQRSKLRAAIAALQKFCRRNDHSGFEVSLSRVYLIRSNTFESFDAYAVHSSNKGGVRMDQGRLAFTAVYLKSNHGYVGFIEELPGVNSHGRTLDEARETLQKLAAVVFDEERREAEELIAGKDVVRESFF